MRQVIIAVAAVLTVRAVAWGGGTPGDFGAPPKGWEGLRVGILGDSITDRRQTETRNVYWQYLAAWFKWDAHAYGISGNKWLHIPAQTDRMISEMGDAVDAVLVLAGTNDYAAGDPLGKWYDEEPGTVNWWGSERELPHRRFNVDTNTVCGRINIALMKLKRRYPRAQIVVLTPPKRAYFSCSPTNVQPAEDWPNVRGLWLEDYVRVIREGAAIWGCPVVDLHAESGLTPLLPGEYACFYKSPSHDLLHPNAAGHRRIADLVYCRLKALPAACADGGADAERRGPTLFFAGDSTLDDSGLSLGGKPADPYRSWGSELMKHLRPDCHIANYARSGRSTKSFRREGRWERLIAEVRAGDFVAIQFGHNDQKRATEKAREELWADPKGLFREIVREWVADVRARGATPILLSPICRATFDAEGRRLVDGEHASDGVCLGSYREAMKELSAELACGFVDMNALTRDLLEREGREKAYRYFVISSGLKRAKDGEPLRDTTHPVQAGATAFAQLFLDDVRRQGLAVAQLFATDFPITDFGAATNGVKCTAAFARAIDACAAAGGGRVVVPRGRWLTGAIRLKSDVELHLDADAEVVFSQDPADYLPAVHTSWEGIECWNYCPLVYAYGCTNVAITGKGTLRAYDGAWKDSAWYPWVAWDNGVSAARRQLYDWGATDHPVEKREIWKMKDAHTRPHFVQFNRCKNVRWEGFKIRNSPFWTLHLYLCDGAEVRGLDVYAHGNNNDGIDIEMSRNVLVENCTFDQGDDGVVIKSGRNRDAWRLATPTENVLVRNCRIVNAHTVLGVGSEISGGVRNVRMEDCDAGNVWRALFVKTNRRRGGFVEGVRMENVRVGAVRLALVALSTDTLYEWKRFPDYELRDTRIGGIEVCNVTAEKAGRRLDIVGEARLPVGDVRLKGVRVGSAAEPDRVENVVRLVDE